MLPSCYFQKLREIFFLSQLEIFCKFKLKTMVERHEGRVVPYIAIWVRGIGYAFWGSRLLNWVSFFYPFFAVLMVWSLDRVAKLYYLMLGRVVQSPIKLTQG